MTGPYALSLFVSFTPQFTVEGQKCGRNICASVGNAAEGATGGHDEVVAHREQQIVQHGTLKIGVLLPDLHLRQGPILIPPRDLGLHNWDHGLELALEVFAELQRIGGQKNFGQFAGAPESHLSHIHTDTL